ncbi:ThiF family adenylyltransferase [Candidatus Uhrbacteria bacterium]|nr:ThiF family adenylyltransferase [Candidatus Uhrbacteria bacterium]
MNALNLSQQSKIFNPLNASPVTVIGAGSVGSWVVDILAKLGVNDITVYDEDGIESHNIAPSAYGQDDIGMFKVTALERLVRAKSGVNLKVIQRMYAGEPLKGTVIACVDSMEARKLIWDQVKDNGLVDAFIDTRITVEFLSIFALKPCDVQNKAYYEHFLYPSSEANMQHCGQHSIVFVAVDAANWVVKQLTVQWSGGRMRPHKRFLARDFDAEEAADEVETPVED